MSFSVGRCPRVDLSSHLPFFQGSQVSKLLTHPSSRKASSILFSFLRVSGKISWLTCSTRKDAIKAQESISMSGTCQDHTKLLLRRTALSGVSLLSAPHRHTDTAALATSPAGCDSSCAFRKEMPACSLPLLGSMVSIRVLRHKTHTAIFSHFYSVAAPEKTLYPVEERMRNISRRRGPLRGPFSPRKMVVDKFTSRLTPPDHTTGF
ncbi:hypothetical protein BDP81DRAFT_14580 [Colletotrichum phormii]|uniref:Uncharacterized protein n=1 Tax=Colletotrichum phormii TaxID=359342 RepID=A0AAJ0A6N1_9PEZI|nr:uncharacterized protein BDP81DRAFT_14580 [Colletotrichum phormii]KAK1656051.1 hypothetical protein BDP81DRAFT_14580 [Colletotrichum phormii]